MSEMTRDEARRFGRDMVAKNVIEHERRHGRYISEDKARAYANERADVQDKRKDLGVKE